MPIRATNRGRMGPLRINYGRSGPTSIVLKIGPLTWRLWSRAGVRGLSSVDLPGPWSWRASTRRRTPAELVARQARARIRRGATAGMLLLALAVLAVAGVGPGVVVPLAALSVLALIRYLSARHGAVRGGDPQ